MHINKKYIWLFLLGLFAGTIVNTWYYQKYSGKVVKYWVEPKELNYYDKPYRDYRYILSIVETTRAVGLFSTREYHYDIFISKHSVKHELDMMYGHYKEYGFGGNRKEVKDSLDKCSVRWEKNGIWFIDDTEHKLFFPKSSFMGGR